MLFRKVTAVYSENGTKPVSTLRGRNADLVDPKSRWYVQLPLILKGQEQG